MFKGPLRGDFLGDRMALTTFDSFSGDGEEPAAELRRDEDDLTFVSKWRKLKMKKKKETHQPSDLS